MRLWNDYGLAMIFWTVCVHVFSHIFFCFPGMVVICYVSKMTKCMCDGARCENETSHGKYIINWMWFWFPSVSKWICWMGIKRVQCIIEYMSQYNTPTQSHPIIRAYILYLGYHSFEFFAALFLHIIRHSYN